MDMEIILFLGGLLAGVVNVMAGNGSALTVSLLLGMGMDGSVANATNRIGVVAQTVTSWAGLRKTQRKSYLLRAGSELIIPTLIGSFLGGLVGAYVSADTMEWILAIVMTGMLGSVLTKRQRWEGPSQITRPQPRWKSLLWFFLIGFYGGVVQMGIGVLMLIVLVLVDKWSLRDGNVIKIFMANVLAIPAAIVYVLSGHIEWRPGIILAAGAVIGAWIAARYLVRQPKLQPFVRYILILIVAYGVYTAITKALT